jgi:hypothetical protein
LLKTEAEHYRVKETGNDACNEVIRSCHDGTVS